MLIVYNFTYLADTPEKFYLTKQASNDQYKNCLQLAEREA